MDTCCNYIIRIHTMHVSYNKNSVIKYQIYYFNILIYFILSTKDSPSSTYLEIHFPFSETLIEKKQ